MNSERFGVIGLGHKEVLEPESGLQKEQYGCTLQVLWNAQKNTNLDLHGYAKTSTPLFALLSLWMHTGFHSGLSLCWAVPLTE